MSPNIRWLVGLAAVAVMASYAFLTTTTREPFDGREWEVESVMVLNPNPTTYQLDPPFRILRGGRVTLQRHEESASLPVVRVDMNIDGEHVVVFTRRRE